MFGSDLNKDFDPQQVGKGSNKRELFKILQNVENRNILISKNSQAGPSKINVKNNEPNRQNSISKKSGGRSPIKIMKLVGPESTVPETEKRRHFKLRNSMDEDDASSKGMESITMTKSHLPIDMNKTMPNLKDVLESEINRGDLRHLKTAASVYSDKDEVNYH